MRKTVLWRLLILTTVLGLSMESYSGKDAHWNERDKLITNIEETQTQAEYNLDWSCDPQYQHKLHKIYDQWIPYPPPRSGYKNSTFWHAEFKRLSGYYSDFDCFDIAIELAESALTHGKHAHQPDLESTRTWLEGLQYYKRTKRYSLGNPKHPHYDDPDYDPSDEPLPFEE